MRQALETVSENENPGNFTIFYRIEFEIIIFNTKFYEKQIGQMK